MIISHTYVDDFSNLPKSSLAYRLFLNEVQTEVDFKKVWSEFCREYQNENKNNFHASYSTDQFSYIKIVGENFFSSLLLCGVYCPGIVGTDHTIVRHFGIQYFWENGRITTTVLGRRLLKLYKSKVMELV